MNTATIAAVLFQCFVLFSITFAQTDKVGKYSMQRDRCLRKLEKVERTFDNVAAGIERIKRLRAATSEAEAPRIDAFMEKSRNKSESINNRIERSRNQLEIIASDIQKALSTGECPDCLSANVNLFCRQVDAIAVENDALAAAIGEFERTLRKSASAGELIERTEGIIAAVAGGDSRLDAVRALLKKARSALATNNADAAMAYALEAGDSAASSAPSPKAASRLDASVARVSGRIEEARRAVGNTGGKARDVLDKAAARFENAKTLLAAGKTDEALTELTIAEKFAAAAIDCAARKE